MSRIYSMNLLSGKVIVVLFLVVALLSMGAMTAFAVTSVDNTDFSQVINAGAYLVEFQNSSHVQIGSPVVVFGAETFSFNCKEGGTAASGSLGTASERLYIYNPDAAGSGWTLAIAASSTTDLWDKGDANDYDFNEDSGAPPGCVDDGATTDGDAFGGLLTVDANAGTLNPDCLNCDNTTGMTKGSSNSFDEGTVDSINLHTATSGPPNDIGRWYFTGIDLDQVIPAEQEPGTYTITMVITGTVT